MTINYASHVNRKVTPQTQPIPGQEARQVQNNAGGFVYQIDCWGRLLRFLILGNPGGTYYQDEQTLTRENAQCVLDCAKEDYDRTLNTVIDVNVNNRAPKTSPAIFALALLAATDNPENNGKALRRAHEVLRIPTFFFEFLENLKALRGRGQAVKHFMQNWYTRMPARDLVYQTQKYKNRNGWGHNDVLRIARPKTEDAEKSAIFGYIVGKKKSDAIPPGDARTLLQAIEEVGREGTTEERQVDLIRLYSLPREVLPTEDLNSLAIWDALLEKMPMTAMIRNLAKMSSIGLLTPRSAAAKHVVDQLRDMETLRKARVHPVALLMALLTYKSGKGSLGSLTWTPVPSVIDALNDAFYLSFGFIEPTNKRLLYALDISGSMDSSMISNVDPRDKRKRIPTPLSCRVAAAALAMLSVHTELDDVDVIGFTAQGGFHNLGVTPIPLSKRQRLDDVIAHMRSLSMGRTDCAQPFLWAAEHKKDYDAVVVITDNETYAGTIHPSQAMAAYRQKVGHNVKEVVIGMTATNFTIADPNDPNTMDVVGFDTDAPGVISNFVRE